MKRLTVVLLLVLALSLISGGFAMLIAIGLIALTQAIMVAAIAMIVIGVGIPAYLLIYLVFVKLMPFITGMLARERGKRTDNEGDRASS